MAALQGACSAFRYGWVGDDVRPFGPQQLGRPVGERGLICCRKHRCHRRAVLKTRPIPRLAIKAQQAAERDRQQIEVLARQLASAREDVGTLTARVTALTDARSEAEKALQTAQALAAEQKLALEQERQRGEALARELTSAREEVEARKAAANAADASAKTAQASAAEQKQAAEQERQQVKSLPISWHRPERMSEL